MGGMGPMVMMGGMGPMGMMGGMQGMMGMLMGLLMGILLAGMMGGQHGGENNCRQCQSQGNFGGHNAMNGVGAFGGIGQGFNSFLS